MKTDREFIDGIYEKAKNYNENDNNITFFDVSSQQTKRAKLQLVACLTLVLLTGIGYSNSNFIQIDKMELPQSISNNYQYLGQDQSNMVRSNQPMVMSLGEDLYYNPIDQADVICAATVVKIEKGNYDELTNSITTNVLFKAIDTLKGEINNEFQLIVSGGFDDNDKVYSDYEAVFEVDEEVLLFLETSYMDTNLYILAGESLGKYSLANDGLYVNPQGEYYTLDDLKTHFNLQD